MASDDREYEHHPLLGEHVTRCRRGRRASALRDGSCPDSPERLASGARPVLRTGARTAHSPKPCSRRARCRAATKCFACASTYSSDSSTERITATNSARRVTRNRSPLATRSITSEARFLSPLTPIAWVPDPRARDSAGRPREPMAGRPRRPRCALSLGDLRRWPPRWPVTVIGQTKHVAWPSATRRFALGRMCAGKRGPPLGESTDMPGEGFEPPRPCGQSGLSRSRLPENSATPAWLSGKP
jgi:hypothetical protein